MKSQHMEAPQPIAKYTQYPHSKVDDIDSLIVRSISIADLLVNALQDSGFDLTDDNRMKANALWQMHHNLTEISELVHSWNDDLSQWAKAVIK